MVSYYVMFVHFCSYEYEKNVTNDMCKEEIGEMNSVHRSFGAKRPTKRGPEQSQKYLLKLTSLKL